MDDRRPPTAAQPPRKRPSPFRVKVGCVVALRRQITGNSVTIVSPDAEFPVDLSEWVPVWTAPCPGRDEGLALLGQCLRVFLPSELVKDAGRRVLEGHVVGVHASKPTKVHLLVHQRQVEAFPFLPRVPMDTSKRHAALEESIRGVDTVMIQLRLRAPGQSSHNHNNKSLPWAILKLVPHRMFWDANDPTDKAAPALDRPSHSSAKPSSRSASKRTVKYMGDGHDSSQQQVANWRWLASRYHDRLLRHWTEEPIWEPPRSDDRDKPLTWSDSERMRLAHILAAGWVGVVRRVCVTEGAGRTASLASVQLERLVLPQHTAAARNDPYHVYQDHDHRGMILQVPIEQLIVIAKALERRDTHSQNTLGPMASDPYMLDRMILSQAYSLNRDAYVPLDQDASSLTRTQPSHPCHCCRQVTHQWSSCSSCTGGRRHHAEGPARWCHSCLGRLQGNELPPFPCCRRTCDCQNCQSFRGSAQQDDLYATISRLRAQRTELANTPHSVFAVPLRMVMKLPTIDFGLPRHMLDLHDHPKPLSQVSTRLKQVSTRRSVNLYKKSLVIKGNNVRKPRQRPTPRDETDPTIVEDYTCFQPSCARHCELDEGMRLAAKRLIQRTPSNPHKDRPRNLRQVMKEVKWKELNEKEDKQSNSSRAARANQRRFMKDVSFLGAHGLNVDSLATRESQIRFDRSGIHAWGVYADEDISPEEMIIEYKGELIGNAVAEKREKNYEHEKIGSDYMFRIDSTTVCDATKQGNVARFINASCDPNCYTKIITIDGSKRIVIYSKTEISAGEELTYDYKFPLEYDPAKRISCHCGAKDCRGFMNWHKKYIVVDAPKQQHSDEAMPANEDEASNDDESVASAADDEVSHSSVSEGTPTHRDQLKPSRSKGGFEATENRTDLGHSLEGSVRGQRDDLSNKEYHLPIDTASDYGGRTLPDESGRKRIFACPAASEDEVPASSEPQSKRIKTTEKNNNLVSA